MPLLLEWPGTLIGGYGQLCPPLPAQLAEHPLGGHLSQKFSAPVQKPVGL